MEIQELQVFVKVVQCASFTKAAELLGTSKAQVSRVITSLEARLQARLLQRSTRSLHLTEVGREVFERAVGILAAVEDTERVAARQRAEPAGNLRLTCGAEFGILRANGWVNSFLARYPQVTAEVEYTSRVLDMVHEGFDLAIRLGELQDSRLSARRLMELHYGLYASPDYLARHGSPATPEALQSGHSLLMFANSNNRYSWSLRQGETEVRVSGDYRLKANNSFGVRDAALAGLGIARVPELLARRAVAAGQLSVVLPDWQLPVVAVNAVFASNRYLAPKVRAFIDHVVEIAPNEPAPHC